MRKLLIVFCLLFTSSLFAQIGITTSPKYRRTITRTGHNGAIGTSYETVWDGSTVYSYIGQGQVLRIVCKSTNDDTSGTGALTIKISGLDSLYAIASETISLGGTDTVETTGKFVRIWDCEIMTAGSGGANADTVQVFNDSSTDTLLAYMPPGCNRTKLPLFTVPADHSFYIGSFKGSQAVAKQTKVMLMARPFGEVFRPYDSGEVYLSPFNGPYAVVMKFLEKTDIEVRALTIGGAGDMVVKFCGWYEPNN